MKSKKVILDLVGVDGNAFVILGTFRQYAKKQGWTAEKINAVCDEAKAGDYNHLLATISAHCEAPEDDE